MASIQLTAQRRVDAIAILKHGKMSVFFNDIRNHQSMLDSLESASDTDNMTCTVDELELLKNKIKFVKFKDLTAQAETDILDLADTVEAAITAG